MSHKINIDRLEVLSIFDFIYIHNCKIMKFHETAKDYTEPCTQF